MIYRTKHQHKQNICVHVYKNSQHKSYFYLLNPTNHWFKNGYMHNTENESQITSETKKTTTLMLQ